MLPTLARLKLAEVCLPVLYLHLIYNVDVPSQTDGFNHLFSEVLGVQLTLKEN